MVCPDPPDSKCLTLSAMCRAMRRINMHQKLPENVHNIEDAATGHPGRAGEHASDAP